MNPANFDYIKKTYNVPARRGLVVVLEGTKRGVITASDGAHLRVRFEGSKHSVPVHPTWEIVYYSKEGNQLWPEPKLSQQPRRF